MTGGEWRGGGKGRPQRAQRRNSKARRGTGDARRRAEPRAAASLRWARRGRAWRRRRRIAIAPRSKAPAFTPWNSVALCVSTSFSVRTLLFQTRRATRANGSDSAASTPSVSGELGGETRSPMNWRCDHPSLRSGLSRLGPSWLRAFVPLAYSPHTTCSIRLAVATTSAAVRPHICSISCGVLALLGIRFTYICSSVNESPDCVNASARAEPRPPP